MADQTDRQRAEAKEQEFIRMAKADIDLWKHYHGGNIHLSAQAASYLQSMLASGTAKAYELGRREGWEAGREEAAKVADEHAKYDPTLWRSAYNHAAEQLAAALRALKPKEQP